MANFLFNFSCPPRLCSPIHLQPYRSVANTNPSLVYNISSHRIILIIMIVSLLLRVFHNTLEGNAAHVAETSHQVYRIFILVSRLSLAWLGGR